MEVRSWKMEEKIPNSNCNHIGIWNF